MSTPAVADGHPIHGDLLAVLDESTPANSGGGVAYVVTTAAVFQPNEVKLDLGSMFPPNRKRPFHWAQEGIEARSRILEIVATSGIIAVAYYAHVGRRQQVPARRAMLSRAAEWVHGEGVEHLILEASDNTTISRDQATLLDAFRESGGVPFRYDWRSKSESLLWLADAIAGAVGEHVIGKDDWWYEQLVATEAICLLQHP